MKPFQLIAVIFCCFLFYSCGRSRPETILGIRLGNPVDEQIELCLSNGSLKLRNKDSLQQKYVEYEPTLIGDLYINSFHSSSGKICAQRVLVMFLNPILDEHYRNDDPSLAEYPYYSISGRQKTEIQNMYVEKYGRPTKEYQDIYTWDKGDLEIILRIDKVRWSLFSAWASYTYTNDIDKEIDKEDSKNFKGI